MIVSEEQKEILKKVFAHKQIAFEYEKVTVGDIILSRPTLKVFKDCFQLQVIGEDDACAIEDNFEDILIQFASSVAVFEARNILKKCDEN